MSPAPREPSRLPVRGTIAAAGTVGALALLLSFEGGPLAPTDRIVAAGAPEPPDEPINGQVEASAVPTGTSGAEAVVERLSYTGEAVHTRWGEVQVEVTLEGPDITGVAALQMPASDRHTIKISEYVEPILREEAIESDSAAGLSVISGATYTSEAYADSIQSALDQAGLDNTDVESELAAEAPVEEVLTSEQATEVENSALRTATGEVVAIRWGEVQVAVTVEGDDIIDVETLSIPMQDLKSERINSRAEPVLREEAIASDSADVSVISGATYTSQAYAMSLQSALDQLGV